MRIFLSSLGAFFAAVGSGLVLEQIYTVDLLFRSSVMALWLMAIAPWLYADGRRLTKEFLQAHREHTLGKERYEELSRAFEGWMKSGSRWLVSLSWSVIATWVVAVVLYQDVTGFALAWVLVTFGLLFLISFQGYWAWFVMIRLIRRLSTVGVQFNPYHPDLFGGLGAVGTFAVRCALYFSSGALLLPLAFETVAKAQADGAPTMTLLAYVLTAAFIAAVVVAFAMPVFDIKRFVDRERARVTIEARFKLESLMDRYRSQDGHDEHLARQIEFCHLMECSELTRLRDYPYDVKVISELLLAVAFPLGLVILEAYLRH